MNTKKQMDLIRKRNSMLNDEIDELKYKIALDKKLNSDGYEYVKDLISDLEKIKLEWMDTLVDLRSKQSEYSFLIDDLKIIKKIFADFGFKVPWYKKWKIRLLKKFY